MNTYPDIQETFYELQETTKTGWWQWNVKEEVIHLSSFLMDWLGRETDSLAIKEFITLLSARSRESIRKDLKEVLRPGHSGEKVWIRTPQGSQYVWIGAVLQYESEEAEIIEGYLKILDEETMTLSIEEAETDLNKQLNWQRTFSESLWELSDNTSHESAIQHLLDLLRNDLDADAIRIFSFEHSRQTYSCHYQSSVGIHSPEKINLPPLSFNKKGWIQQILMQKTVFINEANECESAPIEEGLGYEDTKSSLLIPLLSGQEVWGFMRIDNPNSHKGLKYMDRETFQSMASVVGVCLDRIHSEEGMNHKSQFLEKLLHNMPVGYFRLRMESGENDTVTGMEVVDVNRKFTEIIGIEEERLLGKTNFPIGSFFEGGLDQKMLTRIARKGKTYQFQKKLKTLDLFYEVTAFSPQYGEVVVLFKEVTEAVRTSEELRLRGEELKKIYTNIPVGIEVYDKNGYLIEVNEQVLELEKVPQKEALIGLNLFDHPSLPAFANDLLKQGKDVTFDVNLEAMKVNREYYGVHSMEELKYLTLKCTVIYNSKGTIENYLLIIIDNTEIYNTSKRLTEFESAFHSMAKIAEVGFFRWNPLRKTYYSSDQSFRNMGVKSEAQANFTFEDFIGLIHPEDAKEVTRYMEKVIAGLQTSHTFEFRITAGKKWRWLRGTSRVIEYDPENKNILLTGLNYRIDEIKKTEQKLVKAKLKAEESDRRKSDFLANISHEIRTPLNAIVGFSELVAEAEDDEEKKQYIEIIQTNNEHLLALVSDIINLSQIESDSFRILWQNIKINPLCSEMIEKFQGKIPEGIEMRFIHPDNLPEVTIVSDPKWIKEVLSILLSNAIKFTQTGSILLCYKVYDHRIEFSVNDTGMGIPAEYISIIFDRFMKIDTFIPGTGLGLAICKSILQRLDGEIGVDSKLGEGSRFWFTLPRK